MDRHPAKTSLVDVKRIAFEHFAIKGTAASLSSERDETFAIEGDDDRNFILKIAHPDERWDLLSFQTDVLLHLETVAPALPVPRVVPSPEGALISLPFGDGSTRIVRALSFLDGLQLYKAPHSLSQMRNLGRTLAQLDMSLSQLDVTMPSQTLLWDITNAAALIQHVKHTEPSRQTMVLEVFDAFQKLASGPLKNLPQQIIHNDFNPHNVLVSASDPSLVTGIIDFGDVVAAARINDVAVALSYQIGATDGIASSAELLRGYQTLLKLEAEEIESLPTLLRTRLAMTLVITEWRAQTHPHNRDYILRNHPSALAGLKAMSEYTDSDLATLFKRELGDL